MKSNYASIDKRESASVIKSLRNSYFLKNLDLECLRSEWDREYSRSLPGVFTEKKLFTPVEYSFKISDSHSSYNERIALGFWGIHISRNPTWKRDVNQEWNFCLSVSCGNSFVFHPMQARYTILKYHGHSIYDKWRHVVLEDLERFSHLLSAYNPPKHISSPTCSISSSNVCKKVGLPVQSGIAYLLKNKGKECAHKNRSYRPLDWSYSV